MRAARRDYARCVFTGARWEAKPRNQMTPLDAILSFLTSGVMFGLILLFIATSDW